MAGKLTDEQVTDVVREAISLALAVEPEEVAPEKLLVDELDAESIDFLDITFRLEQRLPIVVPRDDLTEQAEEIFGESVAVDTNRELTPFGAYLIQQRLAGVDVSQVEAGMKAERIAGLWTVQSWVTLCQRLMDTIPETCTACSGARTFTETGGEFKAVCGECASQLHSVPGDELNKQWFDVVKNDPEVEELINASRPVLDQPTQ